MDADNRSTKKNVTCFNCYLSMFSDSCTEKNTMLGLMKSVSSTVYLFMYLFLLEEMAFS